MIALAIFAPMYYLFFIWPKKWFDKNDINSYISEQFIRYTIPTFIFNFLAFSYMKILFKKLKIVNVQSDI